MPTVLREQGFRFFFFSNEGSEPPHVHVQKGDAVAKVWLNPIGIAHAQGLNPVELRSIRRLVFANRAMFLQRWNEHFAR